MSIQEDWRDPQAPKRGMSTTSKVLLILGGIGGVCLLLCCGGGAFLYFRVKDAIENAVVMDPKAIRERTAEIVSIDIPPGFEPLQSVNALVMRWAVYGKNPDDGSRLKLMGMDRAMVDSANPEMQKMQMLQMMQQQGTTPGGEPVFVSREAEQREIVVRGEPAKFEFAKGTAAASGKEMRQVTGSFKTPGGMGLILFVIPEESYDEAAIVKMLESISDPQPAAAPVEAGAVQNAPPETEPSNTDSADGQGDTPPAEQPAADKPDGAQPAVEKPPEQ